MNNADLAGRQITVKLSMGGRGGKPCFDHQRGRCTRGDMCRFSHDGPAGGGGFSYGGGGGGERRQEGGGGGYGGGGDNGYRARY